MNELSHEAKLIADAVRLYSLPISFGDHWASGENATVRNGTACLLHLEGGPPLAVTAQHVVEGYRTHLDTDPEAILQVGEGPLSLDSLISEDKTLDLAVFDVSTLEDKAGANWRHGNLFYQPKDWPPSEVSVDDVLGFSGFVGSWKDVEDDYVGFHALTAGAALVEDVDEDRIITGLRINESDTWLRDTSKPYVDNPGLSGSPVFAWRKLFPELVGFIVEEIPAYDAIVVRKAKFLRPDGTISTPSI